MPFMIPEDLSLQGDFVALEAMTPKHESALNEAVKDGELWNLTCTSVPSPDTMAATIKEALIEKAKGDQFPFVVRRLSDNKVVGSSRYYWMRPQNKNLSIGYTWYAKSAQRTVVNTECKLLLLTFAFEQLNCISVALHVDDTNEASKAAVARIGAKHEGVLRNDRIMPDGRIRHTHCFSIIDSEWSKVKQGLERRLT